MDYEKKYKALIEAVKMPKEANPSDKGIQNWVNDNVPELKMSDDERIRKWLIGYFQRNKIAENIKTHDIIAWLEKQGSEENKGNLGGISPNSAWSEEDERNIQVIDSVLFYDKSLPEDTCMRLRNLLESLKQRLRE